MIPLGLFQLPQKLGEHLNGFENGSTVTIQDGFIQAPSPTLPALLDTLAGTLRGYGSLPFELDADYNIARGIIERIGLGEIVRRDYETSDVKMQRREIRDSCIHLRAPSTMIHPLAKIFSKTRISSV